MPPHLTSLSRGEPVTISAAYANESDSAAAIEGLRVGLVGPEFLVAAATASKAGPVDIPPGQEYTFELRYELRRDAPYGCFRAFLAAEDAPGSGYGTVPDIEDEADAMDFVVLPSTGSFGRFWRKAWAGLGCRRRLAAAVQPSRKTRCLERIAGLVKMMESSRKPMVLSFGPADRRRASVPWEEVAREASAGSIPAVLELGFREGRKTRELLRSLARRPAEFVDERVSAERADECRASAQAEAERLVDLAAAARQALARLGDEEAFREFERGLASEDPDAVFAALAAMAYVGNDRAVAAVGPLLGHKGLERAGQAVDIVYAAMAALAQLEPQKAREIEAASSSPEERLEAWRSWWASRAR